MEVSDSYLWPKDDGRSNHQPCREGRKWGRREGGIWLNRNSFNYSFQGSRSRLLLSPHFVWDDQTSSRCGTENMGHTHSWPLINTHCSWAEVENSREKRGLNMFRAWQSYVFDTDVSVAKNICQVRTDSWFCSTFQLRKHICRVRIGGFKFCQSASFLFSFVGKLFLSFFFFKVR